MFNFLRVLSCVAVSFSMFAIPKSKVSLASDTLVIGISGGSASGKTTLAKNLVSSLQPKLPFKVCYISQDSYYLPLSDQLEELRLTEPEQLKGSPNWDHPKAVDLPLLSQHLIDLKNQKTIQIPTYDFMTSDRTSEVQELGPCEIVILEGIFVLHDPQIFKNLDIKVYVDLDDSTRFSRRLERDVKERGRTEQSVLDWNRYVAQPMFEKFVRSTQHQNGVIRVSGENTQNEVEALSNQILEKFMNRAVSKSTEVDLTKPASHDESSSSHHSVSPDLLQELLPSNRFYLSRAESFEIAKKLGISIEQLMVELIPLVKQKARSLISNYHVGAIGKARVTGNLIFGVNLEIPGQALNQAVHSEQFMIALAHGLGEKGIESMAVSAAPCGHCRQFMNELDHGTDTKFYFSSGITFSLKDLLPHPFGPHDLGIQGGLLNAGKANSIELKVPSTDPMVLLAYRAAEKSYAPYSKSPAGVSIQIDSGEMFAGSYLENAAFNPSLSPIQAALVNLVAAGKEYHQIWRVVLVERKESATSSSQYSTTQEVAKALSPHSVVEKFEIF